MRRSCNEVVSWEFLRFWSILDLCSDECLRGPYEGPTLMVSPSFESLMPDVDMVLLLSDEWCRRLE